MRCLVLLATATALTAVPSLALAQSAENCPPGGWFCEESETPEEDAPPDEAPPAADEPPADAPPESPPARRGPPPRVVVAPPGSRVIIVDRPENEPQPAPKRHPRRRHHSEWGVNLRLQSVLMGQVDDGQGGTEQPDPSAGMSGMGISLRWRPIGHFALDGGFDFFAGRDWYGYERRERSFALNGMLFVNPRDAVQFYVLGGFNLSNASVARPMLMNGDAPEAQYSYFGGQLGFGVEFRISKVVALNLDLVGFMRGRTDAAAATEPEYVDPATNRVTNKSGGGLFRGGVTFYW